MGSARTKQNRIKRGRWSSDCSGDRSFLRAGPADRDQRSKGVALDNHWEKVGDVQPSGEPRGDDAEVSEDFDEGFDQLETPKVKKHERSQDDRSAGERGVHSNFAFLAYQSHECTGGFRRKRRRVPSAERISSSGLDRSTHLPPRTLPNGLSKHTRCEGGVLADLRNPADLAYDSEVL